MRAAMQWAPLALLFLAAVAAPSQAQNAEEAEGGPLVYWDVGRALELTCNISNPDKLPVVWSKNASALSAWPEVAARARLEEGGARLVLPQKTHEDDFGNYSCAVGGSAMGWRVHGRAHAKLPLNTNVVEGQKLKLTCRLVGKPYPAVAWLFSNHSANGSDMWAPLDEALGGRAELADSEQGVVEGELTVAAAALGDAGRVACVPLLPGQAEGEARADAPGAAVTVLRVKDMYAALWPFLGICAEVFVLCAIILIYEKRRTKPELDDSDTDNHDQKKS